MFQNFNVLVAFFSTPVFWAKADAKIRRFLILANFFSLPNGMFLITLYPTVDWMWNYFWFCIGNGVLRGVVWCGKGGLFGGFEESFLTEVVDKFIKYWECVRCFVFCLNLLWRCGRGLMVRARTGRYWECANGACPHRAILNVLKVRARTGRYFWMC